MDKSLKPAQVSAKSKLSPQPRKNDKRSSALVMRWRAS
jgi:hypothetical protein